MLSVLIVDDEAYVCDGIENNIPWDEFGIGNIHQAHTGREGLAIAEHLKPDIIISDVRMPHMDGLDMASALQEMGIQPQIIFMSAYSELSYYKKALKLHAVSFVEKPIILEELYAEIRHAVERIRAARGPRLSEEELRAYGLGSLLRGGNAPAADAFRKRLVGFSCYTLCVIRCATATLEQCGKLTRDVQPLLPSGVQTVIALDSPNILAVAAWPKARPGQLQRLGKALLDQCHTPGTFITGGACTSLEGLPQVFQQAMERQVYAFFYSVPAFDDGTRAPSSDTAVSALFQRALAELQRSADGLHLQSVRGTLERYFADLAQSGVSPDRARSEALALLSQLRTYMCSKGLVAPYAYCWNDVACFSLLDELQAFCCRQAEKMVTDLSDLLEKGRSAYLIMQEIQAGYCQPGFSIATLSEKLHFSESYLSSVFKKQYDMTIGTYINKLRMEKAKALLLLPGARISQVAAQVGFDDTDYFTKRFRQYTGQTPTEYRR